MNKVKHLDLAELKVKYEIEKDAKRKIDIKLDIVAEMRLFDNNDAIITAKEARIAAIEENYTLGIGRSTYAIGMCYWQIGDYEQGVNELKEGLHIAKKLKNKKLEAKCYNILGNIYRDLGEVSNALKNYLNALDIFEKQNDEHTTGVVMKNISNLHFDLFDYDNALDYALRSVFILEKYENKNRMVSVYHTLGNIYFKKEDFENAISYFYKCLELTEPNSSAYALATSGVGKVYYMMQQFNKAITYLQHAEQLGKETNYFESYIVATFYLGRLALDENKIPKALEYFNKSILSAKEHNRKHDIMSVHEWLAIAYEFNNDLPNAYYNLKSFEQLKTEIFEQDGVNKLRNMQVQHEIAFAQKDKEVAERTASLKQQFLANMSHEIRTPMNAIMGMSRLLKEKEHLPHQEKYLNAILTSANNLLVIINDILDLSKLEAGKIEIENIAFSLRQAVNNVYELLRFKAHEKQIKFKIEIENSIQDIIIGDPTRLTQILINLVGNALKFTENGNVTIQVRTRKIQDEIITLKFNVLDTGVGISEDYVNNLFEKFTQAGSDTARKYGGTGLGLSITKQLLDLMNGNISVKSKSGEGTTFTFEIPFGIEPNQELQSIQQFNIDEKSKNILNNLHILLVEDNEFNQILLIDTLKDIAPNIKIDVANNGLKAIEKAKDILYDIILMDIQMPEMNGVQATTHIRSLMKAPFNEVKIIAMTANVMKEDIAQYFNAGMNEYVSKPFNTVVLVQKIIKLISPNKKMEYEKDVNKNQIVSQEISEKKETVINLSFLQTFTNNDILKQTKYIKLFLENAPIHLKNIISGWDEKKYDIIKINAHSLKSLLNYVGVNEKDSKIFEIEKESESIDLQKNLQEKINHLQLICNQAFQELNLVIT